MYVYPPYHLSSPPGMISLVLLCTRRMFTWMAASSSSPHRERRLTRVMPPKYIETTKTNTKYAQIHMILRSILQQQQQSIQTLCKIFITH